MVVTPLVAIETLHASTFIVTVLNAAIWLPWLAVTLIAGAATVFFRKRLPGPAPEDR
jgi:hypothetical protein